jgi:hypothetical protein
MDFLKPYLRWQVGLGLLVFVAAAYFIFRWFTVGHDGFLDLGEPCNPQIENACGDNAKCQPDETGEKGVCFPREEEESSEEGVEAEAEAENVSSE